MTDNERMDRAKRIKRMREGRRGGEDASDDEDAAGDEPTGEDSPDEPTETSGESVPAEDTPAEANGGAQAATEESEEDLEVQETATTTTDASQEAVEDDSAESAEAIESTSGSRAELPDPETMEAALEEEPEEVSEVDTDETDEETGGPAAGIAGEAVETTQEADTRVLEFTLADEQYGLDIRYIEEIVKHTNITRVPNTPPFVEGVVDLRGQITTILNPKETIGKDDTSRGDLIVVFDSKAFDDQNIGWVVDDVRQVSPVHDEQVNDPPMEEEYINGVIDRDEDEQFVIWTTPDLALEEAG